MERPQEPTGGSMTDATVTAFKHEGQKFSLELLGCLIGAVVVGGVTALQFFDPTRLTPPQSVIVFFAGNLIAVFGAWRQAILDDRLPPLTKNSIKHDHITGWGFIAIALAVSLILALASWATSNAIANRDIHAQWGVYVVFGLAVVFVIAALAPPINLNGDSSRSILGGIGKLVHPFGLLLSAIDSLLVFAVAGSAGVRQRWVTLRYGILFALLIPCGLLGFKLDAPWSLFPLAWGFVSAIAISRRWAWVEDDRDVYMLNQSFGTHLRVGFDQDLRDEALLSFMSMFFFVPLALMQGQAWSQDLQHPLFKIEHLNHAPTLIDWIGYFGTELAKAAPFVDWAEVYQVHGDENFVPTQGMGEHVLFAMRVLVDLVFLAALVQALAISARNAKQMEMFNAGTLDRLDPFTEPREFRRLIQRGASGAWEINEAQLTTFPKYDAIRLAQLSDPQYAPINIAAIALRRRDGSDDAAVFMEQLEERAFQKQKDPSAIDEALNAIRVSNAIVPADELDRVRIELNHHRALNGARETIVRLISRCPPSQERFEALRSVLKGLSAFSDGQSPESVRDSIGSVRRIAVEALRPQVLGADPDAIRLIDDVAQNDGATLVRRAALEILEERRGSGAAGAPSPLT